MLKPVAALSRSRGNPPLPGVLLLAVAITLGVVLAALLGGSLLSRSPAAAQGTSPLTIQVQTNRVGIGTTTPGFTLDVNGPATATAYYTLGSVGIGTTTPAAKFHLLDQTGNVRLDGTANPAGYSSPTSGIRLAGYYASTNAEIAGIRFNTLDGTPGVEDGSMHFATMRDGVLSTKLAILNDGNVGIGTTVPGDKLDVAGNLRISAGYHLVYNGTSGVIDWGAGGLGNLYFRTLATQGDIFTYSDRMIILNNGNVGIGTTTPGALLDLWGSTSGTTQKTLQIDGNISFNILGSNPPGVNKGLYWYSAGTTGGNPVWGYIYREQATGKLYIGSQGGGTILETANGGNVGIGTTSPSDVLQVSNGALRVETTTPLFRLRDTSAASGSQAVQMQVVGGDWYFGMNTDTFGWQNANVLVLKRNGYVGIGTAAPPRLSTLRGPSRARRKTSRSHIPSTRRRCSCTRRSRAPKRPSTTAGRPSSQAARPRWPCPTTLSR